MHRLILLLLAFAFGFPTGSLSASLSESSEHPLHLFKATEDASDIAESQLEIELACIGDFALPCRASGISDTASTQVTFSVVTAPYAAHHFCRPPPQ